MKLGCGLPLARKPVKSTFAPKAHVSGIVGVMPFSEGRVILDAFGHDAEPAVGFEGAV